jgi:hypothetical protein
MQLRSALGAGHQIAHPIEWYLDALVDAGVTGRVAGVRIPR